MGLTPLPASRLPSASPPPVTATGLNSVLTHNELVDEFVLALAVPNASLRTKVAKTLLPIVTLSETGHGRVVAAFQKMKENRSEACFGAL